MGLFLLSGYFDCRIGLGNNKFVLLGHQRILCPRLEELGKNSLKILCRNSWLVTCLNPNNKTFLQSFRPLFFRFTSSFKNHLPWYRQGWLSGNVDGQQQIQQQQFILEWGLGGGETGEDRMRLNGEPQCDVCCKHCNGDWQKREKENWANKWQSSLLNVLILYCYY